MGTNTPYLTYQEAQEKYQVGRSKLQRLVVTGVITAYRPGKETMLDSSSLDAWFRTTKIAPKKRLGRPRKRTPRI